MNSLPQKKNIIIISLALILLILIILLPTPKGLSVAGKHSIAVFMVAILLWVTHALPLSVTGLLIIALIPLLRITTADEAFALFGNSAVFFILGAFIIATATMKSGLSRRMAITLLRHFDSNPKFLIFGILVTCCLMAFIMPAHAVAALMFPVLGTVASSLELTPLDSEYGATLFVSMGWGSVIGSVGTLLGGARNPLALAILQEKCGVHITFFEWMKSIIPLSFILLIVCYLIIIFNFKIDIPDVKAASKKLDDELKEIGSMSFLEKKVLIILILTVFLWIFANRVIGLAVTSLLSVVLLFCFQCLNWDDVHNYVNWGILLMYGGAVVMARSLEISGATLWIVNKFICFMDNRPLVTMIFFTLLAKVITEGVSNVACVAILLPIALTFCPRMGIDPKVMTYFVAVSSGLAFILPVSTPPNAIAFSSGYYEINKVIKPGIILNIVSLITFIITALLYWPLIGLSLG